MGYGLVAHHLYVCFFGDVCYDLRDERVDYRIDPLVALDLGLDDALFFKDGEVLRDDRLGLIEAYPELRDTWVFLLSDHAEELQANRMSAHLQLRCARGEDFL